MHPYTDRSLPPTAGPLAADPYRSARRAAAVHPIERHRLDDARQALVDELEHLDRMAAAWLRARRRVIEQARALHERLWPTLPDHRTRRPPAPGAVPMPPVTEDPWPVRGNDLRVTAVALLHRHGALRLVELHSLLHFYGYVVDSPRPVKTLADAIGREAEAGRAERIERGTYRAVGRPDHYRQPDGLPDPADPVLRLAPERWWHGWPRPGGQGGTLGWHEPAGTYGPAASGVRTPPPAPPRPAEDDDGPLPTWWPPDPDDEPDLPPAA